MKLTKYERVVGVVVQPAEIHTVDGLTVLQTVTIWLPGMTTLYEPAEVASELIALRQQLAQKDQALQTMREVNDYDSKYQVELEQQLVAAMQAMEEVGKLKAALELYKSASYQSHNGHWDKTGQSGGGCPECLRVRDLRNQAEQVLTLPKEAQP